MDGKVTKMRPLTGALVLDFSQAEAGPIAAQVLGDFGARVIKVERFPDGDLLRKDWGHEANGFYLPFASMNRGKESICLDVRSPEGRQIVDRLLARADVLVHNFRSGVMERLGLGYEELHQRFPRLVYAEATGFGSVGPWADKGGQDILAQAMGGAMWQNSPDGKRPVAIGYPVADYSSGMGVLSGVLMALLLREKTGEGSKVETSLLEGLLFSMVQEVTEARSGFALTQGNDPLCGIFEAGDGFLVAMPIWRPDAAQVFLTTIGLGAQVSDPRLATIEARRANAGWCRDVVEQQLKTNTVAYWIARLDEAKLLCSPVLRMTELAAHEQVQAVQPFVTVKRSDGTVVGHAVRPHMRVDGEVGACDVVPGLGEHGASILAELGYSDAQIAAIGANGAVKLK